ncbi:F0F1 ATP synthase subunit epsilon [Basilea psittacipulmonis]|uniref:ATP synthase epsilon chain n=1 Tax=Basilea psittacipulmonis DSM 24701 TaxID=1072685 RepID=A0A077DEH5_9BURK|nr:F0F1 ATP synthase subunit epsilon [Basilea psittacipulmonis]AIL32571.1 ATP synthase F0F1 subunit epsilon [Basilea psittacipulmonis DSM 24701]
MTTIHVDVVSTEKSIYSGKAKFVALPGESGELGILPGHTPLITKVRPGMVKLVHEDGQEESVFIAGGILEVQPYHVTVLADTAIRADDLDEAKALKAKEEAQIALQNTKDKADIATLEAELAMLAAQIHEARKLSKRR